MSRVKRHKISKKSRQKTVKKKKMSKEMIFTLILAGILVFSVFGIMFSGYGMGGEKRAYGNHEFVKTNEGWRLKEDGKEFLFKYHPEDIDNLAVNNEVFDTIKKASVLYITFDPNTKFVQQHEAARFYLASFLTEAGILPMSGITDDNDMYKQPIVTCANATQLVPVISLEYSNQTKVFLEDGCIRVQADQYDIEPLVDRIEYGVLGVIE